MITLYASRQGVQTVLSWVDTDAAPTSYQLVVSVNGGANVLLGALDGTISSFIDSTGYAIGDELIYQVENVGTAEVGVAGPLTVAEADDPDTFGPVSWLVTAPRYTTVELVKRRLGIPDTNTSRDAELGSTIVAGETTIDAYLGRSFPDTGTNPQIPGIPEAVKQAALEVAVRVWKSADSAGAVAGSDAWFGTVDLAGAVHNVVDQNPILVGLRVSFGVA